jgi:hypothetical protein
MKTLARIASALIAVSAFVLPLSAMAETGHDGGDAHPSRETAGHHHHESAFPMKAEAFKKLVDMKVERMKEHLEKGIARRSLSAEQKAEIEKTMDSGVKELHAAVEKVGTDGVVTRDEAKQIRDLSEQMRNKVRAELRGKHANAKAKGQKPGKGKSKAPKGKTPAKAPEKKQDPPKQDPPKDS